MKTDLEPRKTNLELEKNIQTWLHTDKQTDEVSFYLSVCKEKSSLLLLPPVTEFECFFAVPDYFFMVPGWFSRSLYVYVYIYTVVIVITEPSTSYEIM